MLRSPKLRASLPLLFLTLALLPPSLGAAQTRTVPPSGQPIPAQPQGQGPGQPVAVPPAPVQPAPPAQPAPPGQPAPGQPAPGQPAPGQPVQPAPGQPAVPGQPLPGQPEQAQQPQGPPPSPTVAADVQILLDRASFSPGLIDGRWGTSTGRAIAAFQAAHGLPGSGKVDPATWQALLAAGGNQAVMIYTLTAEDVAGPYTPIPTDVQEKAKLSQLGYTSLGEMLSERFHVQEALLRRLNPKARFAAGEALRVPNVRQVLPTGKVPEADSKALRVTVSKANLSLTVDDGGKVVFFAPVSAGSTHDPLPIGPWKINGVAHNPKFHYNPALFWDADPKSTKATLPPGPNSPVGMVWIDISKDHYGIHGTPDPERIGRTFSHGCVRLTNWDALTVASLVKPGTPVVFTE